MDKVDNSSNRHIFSHSGPVIGLFAKQPVPGQVKTRLTPPLSPGTGLPTLRDRFAGVRSRLLKTNCTITICYAGEHSWFETTFPGRPLFAQHGEGLGARMSNAVEELFAAGGGPVLLAGSDSPDLPLKLVEEAIDHLQRKDVVSVPCRDGGYAIVGLRRPTTGTLYRYPLEYPGGA